jgi:hypothetical protein
VWSVRFASREWIEAVVSALNRHPDLARALAGLPGDAAFVIEAERPTWPADLAAYARHDGRRVAWRLLADADDILELEPAYVLRAPYGTWRGLLNGGDPVKAALSGRVRVDGDLEALVRRSAYRYVVDAALAAVTTEFP